MDLTFQVPMQYCCLQHWTLLPSPVTSTTGWWCCFVSILSFFLELFLHWSPVAYWAPIDLWSSFQYPIILSFHTVHGVPKARILKWFAIPFSSESHFVRTLHHDHLGWLYTAWLRVSLSYTRLWAMWSDKFAVIVVFSLSALWQMGHGGKFWQNMVLWRREWQTSSVFLLWEPHEQYEKAKR